MDHPCDSACTTKHMICREKPASTKVVVTKPFWKDGMTMTNTANLCQMLGWTEEGVFQFNEIALEDYSSTATREERSLHENSWKLSSNAEGANGPLNQRDDFKDGQETCKRLYHEHTAITGCGYTPIPPQQQVRQSPNQQFEGHDEKSYRVDSSGWTYYVPATTHSSSSPSSWRQPSDSRWSTWN